MLDAQSRTNRSARTEMATAQRGCTNRRGADVRAGAIRCKRRSAQQQLTEDAIATSIDRPKYYIQYECNQ
jgi:hypothetical protein